MFGNEGGGRKVVVRAFSWGPIWFIGWLFTIGFAHLGFWSGVLGIVIWPYYLGKLLAR